MNAAAVRTRRAIAPRLSDDELVDRLQCAIENDTRMLPSTRETIYAVMNELVQRDGPQEEIRCNQRDAA